MRWKEKVQLQWVKIVKYKLKCLNNSEDFMQIKDKWV